MRISDWSSDVCSSDLGAEGPFGGFIDGISKWILQFFEDGNGEENLLDLATQLRTAVYEFGTPRQLLFGDVIAAVLRNKLVTWAWKALPRSEERRVGKEGVGQCGSRGPP